MPTGGTIRELSVTTNNVSVVINGNKSESDAYVSARDNEEDLLLIQKAK